MPALARYENWPGKLLTDTSGLGVRYWSVVKGSFDTLRAGGDLGAQDGQWRLRTSGGALSLAVWMRSCGSADMYVKTYWGTMAAGAKGYAVLRYTNATTPFYALVFDRDADTVTWKRMNVAGDIDETIGGPTALTVNVGDNMVTTIEGTGNATTVRVWRNNADNEDLRSASDLNGDTTPDVTFTDNPTTPVDTGEFYGFGGSQTNLGDLIFGDQYGGSAVLPTWGDQQTTCDEYDGICSGAYYEGTDGSTYWGKTRDGVTYGILRTTITATRTVYAGFGVRGTLVNSFMYMRLDTNFPNAGTGDCHLQVNSSEGSGWVIGIKTGRIELLSFLVGYTSYTSRFLDSSAQNALYRWLRFRVSADGLTIYFDAAPDGGDGNSPGTWVNKYSGAISLTPDFHPERCWPQTVLYHPVGLSQDVWMEVDAFNTTRWARVWAEADWTPVSQSRSQEVSLW